MVIAVNVPLGRRGQMKVLPIDLRSVPWRIPINVRNSVSNTSGMAQYGSVCRTHSPILRSGSASIRTGLLKITTAKALTGKKRLMRAEQRARRDAFLATIGTRPIVMGILNLTPDSFSDGGQYVGMEAALSHAQQMAAAGCDAIDVGGESTRPGALAITENEELARIESIFAELAKLEVPLSIDTYKSKVAARAVELGAILINDVWGMQKDPAMAATVAATEAAVVIMHNRAEKDGGIDIIADIRSFFTRSLALAEAAGIPRSHIILDPGVAFG